MNKTNAIVLSIATLSITILLIVVSVQYEKSYRAMINNGYYQKQKIGGVGYIWAKEQRKVDKAIDKSKK